MSIRFELTIIIYIASSFNIHFMMNEWMMWPYFFWINIKAKQKKKIFFFSNQKKVWRKKSMLSSSSSSFKAIDKSCKYIFVYIYAKVSKLEINSMETVSLISLHFIFLISFFLLFWMSLFPGKHSFSLALKNMMTMIMMIIKCSSYSRSDMTLEYMISIM